MNDNDDAPRLRHACERAEQLYQDGFCMIFWHPGQADDSMAEPVGFGWRIVFPDFSQWDQLEESGADPEKRGPLVFGSGDGETYGEAQLIDIQFCPYCGEALTNPPTTRPF